MLADQPLSDSYFDLLNSGKVEIVTAALFSIARIIEMEPSQSSGSAAAAASATSAASISRGAAESKSSDAEAAQTVTRTSDLCGLKKKVVAEMGKAKRVSAALFLIKTARQPVTERKLAVYSVLTAICKQQPGGWGLMALFAAAGFREFLEDRNTEHTKEGKDAKFR
jgi:Proteasome non-ATPase 26S subunit